MIEESAEERERFQKEWEATQRKAEARKYRRIKRFCKRHCPMDYTRLCHEIEYRLHIPYHATTKRVANKYLDTLIGIGFLKKAEDGTVTIGEPQK